MNFGHIW